MVKEISDLLQQGQVYKKIIDTVVEASRTDFEENGVSNDVLLALQEVSMFALSVAVP